MNCQRSSGKRRRFLQFGLRQLFLLFAVVALLIGIVTPRIWKAFEDRRFQSAFREQREIQTNLETAVRQGDAPSVRRALDAGADPNRSLGEGQFLLRQSIENGQIEIMQMLLDSGAAIQSASPLHTAIECRQPQKIRLEMIRRLLRHGADPQAEVNRTNPMDLAVRAADAEVGDLLREHGNSYGPREMAAFNRLEELQRIVEEDPGIVRERFKPVYASRPGQGPTLLGMALYRGYREMALYLIDRGAALDTVEGLGSTLLHKAARGGDPELVRLLVARGLDVNARDDYGDTPLTDSVWCTRSETIDALIDAGADVNIQGTNEETALHMAARRGRLEVVATLLEAGADPSIVNVHGETALDAVRKKMLAMLETENISASQLELGQEDLDVAERKFRKIEELLLESTR